jgi:flagellar motility protein MotE (MotC chaperone)
MDLTESITKALIDHVFLIAGLAVIFWWGLKNVLPREIKGMLTNGGGEIIRRIVKEENAESEGRQSDELRKIIKDHEQIELHHFEKLLQQDGEIQQQLARHDERLKVLEDDVKELMRKN